MLTESAFQTSDLPAQDRRDGFCANLRQVGYGSDVPTEHPLGLWGEVRLLSLGEVSICLAARERMRFLPLPRLIRKPDPDSYHLTLSLHGTADIDQNGHQDRISTHQMHIVDSSRHHEHVVPDVTGVGLDVPRARVPLPPGRVERLLSRPLSGREGIGALLAGLLTQIIEGGPWLPSDEPQLEGIVVDLFSALLAHHLKAEDHRAPGTRSRTLTLRIRAFIEHHLDDPDLTPAAIAAAHHISLRSLHKLFHAEDTTVAALIRHRRLESARHDLMNQALADLPIHAIATRWGFKNHADFTRSYRSTYGIPPSKQRRHRGPGPHGKTVT